ncbi:MAG: nodulation protein NfeD, partial [Calditrichaeota bacterium]|nr:nodulation protein NfeD [Calditrichota bacterium]
GVFITLAAHIAVMAPGTNIGAAHPVTMGGGGLPGGGEKDTTGSSVMAEKMTNDAAAMIRSIAEERGRNIDWAESSVRESKSITATVALESGVIDYILPDIDSILREVHGKAIKLPSGEISIETRGAIITLYEMDWRQRLFNKISDPNIAYILMMLGIYGLIYELSNPSSIFPGVVGGICLLLAFFAFQTLPINTVGILLIVFGILLLLLEIKVPSYGLLTVGGATSLALGSVMLIDTTIPVLKVSLGVIIPTVILTVLFALFVVGLGLKAQLRKTKTGKEGLIGMVGEALEDINPQGKVLVNGEYWVALSKMEIQKGQTIEVTGMKGMKLLISQVSPPEI